jgi:uncharacterized protein (TIGR02001 family)
MTKRILVAAVVAGSMFTGAQAAKSDHDVSLTTGLYSDYRASGTTQTDFKPALQVSLDYVHTPTGLYAGLWGSNVSWVKDMHPDTHGPVEINLLFGKKGDIGQGFSYDGGLAVYVFPGNNVGEKHDIDGNMTAVDVYGEIGYGPGFVRYTHSVTDGSVDPGSRHTGNIELGAATTIPYDLIISGQVGYKRIPNATNVTHWKAGVAYTFQHAYGIGIGLDIVGNNVKHEGPGKNPGKTAPVAYVTKTFLF